MTPTLANQLPRINLADGGSMQSAQIVTLKSGQQNASPLPSLGSAVLQRSVGGLFLESTIECLTFREHRWALRLLEEDHIQFLLRAGLIKIAVQFEETASLILF